MTWWNTSCAGTFMLRRTQLTGRQRTVAKSRTKMTATFIVSQLGVWVWRNQRDTGWSNTIKHHCMTERNIKILKVSTKPKYFSRGLHFRGITMTCQRQESSGNPLAQFRLKLEALRKHDCGTSWGAGMSQEVSRSLIYTHTFSSCVSDSCFNTVKVSLLWKWYHFGLWLVGLWDWVFLDNCGPW